MKVVITQPNFLPWIGYFHQLLSADVFVVFDTVQFARREWQNRNRFVDRNGRIGYLTMPVARSPQKTKIQNIMVSAGFDYCSLESIVSNAYQGLPGLQSAKHLLRETIGTFDYSEGLCLLRDVNYSFIRKISCSLGFSGEILFSSRLDIDYGHKVISPVEKLLAICKACGASQYISSIGAREYMLPELHKFYDSGIEVFWQIFQHESYIKSHHAGPFISHLSVIDFLCHCSMDHLSGYIQSCGAFIHGED